MSEMLLAMTTFVSLHCSGPEQPLKLVGRVQYHPISHTGSNMSKEGPVGYFIIDALDSLLLLGMNDEYERAQDWIRQLSFDLDDKYHNFEVRLTRERSPEILKHLSRLRFES
jgi:hypothetical protein